MTRSLTSIDISATSPAVSTLSSQVSPRQLPLPPSPRFNLDDDASTSSPRPATEPAQSTLASPPQTAVRQSSLPLRSPNQPASIPSTRTRGAGLTMPMMQRAHSSPGVDSTGRLMTLGNGMPHRPSSPLSAGRRRSPLRSAMEDSYPVSSWSGFNIEPNIPEDEELDLSDRLPETELGQVSPMPIYHNTFPRSRRRPASPLHASASAPTLYASARAASPHTTGTQSPKYKYHHAANESFPMNFGYGSTSASSMPSTPSSLRSRSPSISSLETIEDSPDLEEAARIAEEEDSKHRNEDSDGEGSGGVRKKNPLELGRVMRSNKERKRWSVCGAERRADFSLEVIEE